MTKEEKLEKLKCALFCLSLKSMEDLSEHVKNQIELGFYEHSIERVQDRAREIIIQLFSKILKDD